MSDTTRSEIVKTIFDSELLGLCLKAHLEVSELLVINLGKSYVSIIGKGQQ